MQYIIQNKSGQKVSWIGWPTYFSSIEEAKVALEKLISYWEFVAERQQNGKNKNWTKDARPVVEYTKKLVIVMI